MHYEKFQDGTVKCIEDEIPFEIPEGWVWCRGYSCFSGMKNVKPVGEFFDYIDIETIDNRLHKIRAPKHMPVCDAPSRANRSVNYGSVLFSFVRPYLENIAFVEKKNCHCIASTGFYVCNSNGILLPQYMFLMMLSKYVIDGLNQFMKGDNSPSISKDNIENWLYPIPPITEQLRIIHRIDDIIPFLENVENSRRSLVDSINAAKSKILDLAIRGKLVPQDLNDEPASVLLEHIQAEKEELIKQGKIKRDKNDSVIFKGDDNSYYEKMGNKVTCIDDEINFEIPESWMWVRLGTLFMHNTGKALNSSNTEGTELPYITTSNVYWDGFELSNLKSMCFSESEIEKCTVVKGDLLVCEGGDIGRSAIWNFDEPIRIQNHIHRLRAYLPLQTELYYYFMYLYKRNGMITGNGIGLQGLSSKLLHSIIVPLPPINEQKNITTKIKVLFKNLQTMEQSFI